jgi:ubiquinone biosynthesis protein UbiJ
MRLLLSVIPALACAVMVAVVCVPMMFDRRRTAKPPLEAATRLGEVAALRKEVAKLQREVTQLREERSTKREQGVFDA